MKIKWQKNSDSEVHIFLEGENSGYPIGICQRTLTKRGFKWNIQPWFSIVNLDAYLLNREFDNDIEAGRALALLYSKIESRRKRMLEKELEEDLYFGDIMPFSGSD